MLFQNIDTQTIKGRNILQTCSTCLCRSTEQVDVEMDPTISIMISMNNEKIGQFNYEENKQAESGPASWGRKEKNER